MNNFRNIREQKKIKQHDVANALGISRTAYSNYENGKRNPDIETLKRIAEYFNVSIDYLLNHIPNVDDKQLILLTKKEVEVFEKFQSLSQNLLIRQLNLY